VVTCIVKTSSDAPVLAAKLLGLEFSGASEGNLQHLLQNPYARELVALISAGELYDNVVINGSQDMFPKQIMLMTTNDLVPKKIE
jgi:hypothetical protein